LQVKLTSNQATLQAVEKAKLDLTLELESLKKDHDRSQYNLKDLEKENRTANATIQRLTDRVHELEQQTKNFSENGRASEGRITHLTEQNVNFPFGNKYIRILTGIAVKTARHRGNV
jgi:predicted nuclease with TOPRIM domain